MQTEAQCWLTWIRRYDETHDVGLVCRRCGISGPMLRKWLRHYEEQGEAGLVSQSRRPKTSPRRKVDCVFVNGVNDVVLLRFIASVRYPR